MLPSVPKASESRAEAPAAAPVGGRKTSASGAARQAAETLFDLLMAYKKRMLVVSREFGLTLQQAAALRNLDPGKGMPMNALAEALSCDAANVTAVVDKLEARGLVRRAASSDRRVRLLETTSAGAELRERILARMREPTPWINALEPEEQRVLRDLLRKGVSRADSRVGDS
jgi:DNA-binding MarR family transcriptional regulator